MQHATGLSGWLGKGALMAALGGALVLGWQGRGRFFPAEAGGLAPAYAAPTLAGDTLALEALRGRVVLLNVWATWCAPCRTEMPALERLYRRFRARGLEVVAVSVDAAPLGSAADVVRPMVEELGVSFPILLDPDGVVSRRFGVTGLPTTLLIGRDGRVLDRLLGPAPWDEAPYAETIRRALES
jgi:thiol-disulfide isomerase/thioredoxin